MNGGQVFITHGLVISKSANSNKRQASARTEIDQSHANTAKKIALACITKEDEPIDELLLLSIMVGILAMQRRYWHDVKDERCVRDRDTITKVLKETPDSYEISTPLARDPSITSNIVYVGGFPRLKQMIDMLRALASWRGE